MLKIGKECTKEVTKKEGEFKVFLFGNTYTVGDDGIYRDDVRLEGSEEYSKEDLIEILKRSEINREIELKHNFEKEVKYYFMDLDITIGIPFARGVELVNPFSKYTKEQIEEFLK